MKKIVLTPDVDKALYQIFDAALAAGKMQIMDIVYMVRSRIEEDPIEITSEPITPIVEGS